MSAKIRLHLLLAALLVVAAAVLVTGASIERSREDDHQAEVTESTLNEQREEPHDRAGEQADETEASQSEEGEGEGAESSERNGSTEAEEGEKEELFGVNTESDAALAGFLAVSMVLAAAIVFLRNPALLLFVAAFGLAATVLDIRELAQQLDESQGAIALFAGVVAGLHLAATGVAIWIAFRIGATRGDAPVGSHAE